MALRLAGGNGPGPAANQLYPDGLFVDNAGNLYVVDVDNSRVQKWAPGATSGIAVAGGNGAGNAANQLNYPLGLAVDANGDLYIADASNNRVQRMDAGSQQWNHGSRWETDRVMLPINFLIQPESPCLMVICI